MKTIVNYAQKVKEQHALNKTLAPVETDLTSASKAYAVGQKFIHDGVLYQAKTAIAQGAALVLNTNYEAADDVSSEIQALTNKLNNEIATRAMLGAHNLFGVGNSLDEWFAATNDGKLPTSYLASETITGTVDKDTNSIVITAYNNTGYRWGCKKINLKKNTSYTFSRTSCDGTIQLFGKNNADDRAVVISGLSNGGTVNSGDYDWWYVGFYPTRSGGYFSITDLLVNLETDADTTFQPYAKTNQELTAENQTLTQKTENIDDVISENGAKNLLPNNFSTTSSHNITATKNTDGTVSVSTTASGASESTIFSIGSMKLPVGNYQLSGCPNGGSGSTYKLSFVKVGVANLSSDYGEGASCIVDDATAEYAVSIVIYSSTVITTPVIFKPMITLASQPNSDYAHYAPYAMTNRELTENINELQLVNTNFHNGYNADYIQSELHLCYGYKMGDIKYIVMNIGLLAGTIPAGATLFTLNTEYNPKNAPSIMPLVSTTGNVLGYLAIDSGKIITKSAITVSAPMGYNRANAMYI